MKTNLVWLSLFSLMMTSIGTYELIPMFQHNANMLIDQGGAWNKDNYKWNEALAIEKSYDPETQSFRPYRYLTFLARPFYDKHTFSFFLS